MNLYFFFKRVWTMAALVLGLSATWAEAKVERVVERTFAVSGPGAVNVETTGGEIRVVPSADATSVRVVATQRFNTSSQSEADKLAQDIELTIEQAGNDVVAKAKRRGTASRWSWRRLFSWGWRQSVRVDFVVTVPAAFATQLKTSGGDLIVGDMTGPVKATTSGGDVRLGRIGGTVEARTSGGDISLKEAFSGVKLNTSGGDIEAGRLGGDASLSTSGGNIDVEQVEGTLSAHTSGGDVRAEFGDTLAGDSELRTSGGDVHAVVGEAAAFTLDARTSGGRVREKGVEISDTERRSSRLSGAVNGGGPRLQLRSSGGDIVVQTR